MTRNSIRLRLLLAAGAMIVLTLLAAGAAITLIFERHLEKRVALELDKHFTQLVAALEVLPDGQVHLAQQLADPRFTLPLSGLYWQVDLDGKPVARSRSLWDESLLVPTPPAAEEESHIHALSGPDGQNLFSLEKAIYLDHLGTEKLFVVTVGLERGEISDTVLSMGRDVVPALAALGAVLLIATWLQVTHGLKPLEQLQASVQGIREGKQGHMTDDVADEVKPLVHELNALLRANEERNRHARQRAADLAHGLRTPLTVLGVISRRVEKEGLNEEAEKIRIQTEHMRQQVEQELARALSSAEEMPQWMDVGAGLGRLVNVVAMNDNGIKRRWDINVPEAAQCLMTRNDFNEIFGNILENAGKWSKSQVGITLLGNVLRVEDDGPGVATANIDKLTKRGFTTGTNGSSSGLGLAIAQQLAEKNKAQLSFARSQHGGLAVSVQFPEGALRGT